MSSKKTKLIKNRLHPRNKNRIRYDLQALLNVQADLKKYLKPNKNGEDSIDFSKPVAVKKLNQAILSHYYGVIHWDFPNENLCPPIPGRADYIHYAADLLAENYFGNIPTGDNITCLDIGVGASCIYPILGVSEYDWNFIGSDISKASLESSQKIIDTNPILKNKISLRLQENPKDVFYGLLVKEDKVDITVCNPPFHASVQEAEKANKRKVKNLTGKPKQDSELNFKGINDELICEGGESKFISNMIRESANFSKSCLWFTTLVSKQSNLKGVYKALEKYEAIQTRTIAMGTGNKTSRIVAWTFLTKAERKAWREERW